MSVDATSRVVIINSVPFFPQVVSPHLTPVCHQPGRCHNHDRCLCTRLQQKLVNDLYSPLFLCLCLFYLPEMILHSQTTCLSSFGVVTVPLFPYTKVISLWPYSQTKGDIEEAHSIILSSVLFIFMQNSDRGMQINYRNVRKFISLSLDDYFLFSRYTTKRSSVKDSLSPFPTMIFT